MHIKELFDLKDKVAIITGGGRGLGAQMAEGFAQAGASLVLCSRKAAACEDTAQRLSSEYGIKAIALGCDVTNQADVKNVVQTAVDTFRKIDILVNNSGATWGAPVQDMPLDAWNKVMNVNVTGTFLMSQEAGKHMIQQKSGKIINIASVAGLGGTDPRYMDTIAYNTSKGAVITFTKDLAVKWGQYNINVNAIAPGFFPTKMSQVIIENGKDHFLNMTPLKRFGTDQDLKGAALFLAAKASDFMTGDVLVVDGGTHAM
ncbi:MULTISPECIES: SDR family oxidoreductase [Metabacillus]|uniref:Gluconate 5-dehydrogenase n=1 Tax=Metabacillus indicus TaxID=246786 RepID=A0A084H3A2_METID|nr:MULTISPECIES: SDR family oxidoreductase [Metabacillus]KEZ49907.1 gluconate 5-dehydrogenase [Metabacillus indicus LMG 22858]KEZ54064.1 gluconate 5-dehydrogenase [Metabacillus indicus]